MNTGYSEIEPMHVLPETICVAIPGAEIELDQGKTKSRTKPNKSRLPKRTPKNAKSSRRGTKSK